MKSSNWPGGQDLGHSNYTLKFPRQFRGGYAPNSGRIPPSAYFYTAAVVAVFLAFAFIGAAVGLS